MSARTALSPGRPGPARPTAVFLVASPLQLLNAAEARHHFGIAGAEAHLVLFPFVYQEGNTDLLRRLAAQGEWGSVREMLPGGPAAAGPTGWSWAAVRGSWRRLAQAARAAREVGPVDFVFLGNYRDHMMRHFAQRARHRRVVALDDGMSTLAIVRARGRTTSARPRLTMRRRMETLMGGRFGDLPCVTFFSVYRLHAPAGDQVVTHAYAHLRGQVAEAARSEAVYFLGSPFVDLGMYGLEEYLDLMSAAAARFPSRPLVYMPHRAESPATLAEVARRTPFRVERPEFPIEWELARAAVRPRTLCGWYSSALENCHRIFGPSLQIVSLRLPAPRPGQAVPAWWSDVDKAYAYLEGCASPSFRVLPLAPAGAGVFARAGGG